MSIAKAGRGKVVNFIMSHAWGQSEISREADGKMDLEILLLINTRKLIKNSLKKIFLNLV